MKSSRMKFIFFLLFLLIFTCFAFSGCNIIGASDSGVMEYLQPPTPDEEKYKIKTALDREAKGAITLVSPREGSFVSAYNQYDIDGNGTDEAIVFYKEKASGKTILYVHLFVNEDGEWVSSNRIEAKGIDVFSLSFNDLDADGVCEVLIMWERSGTQSDTKNFVIYDFANNKMEYRDERECDDVNVVDLIPGDASLEVVVFKKDDVGLYKAYIHGYYQHRLLPPCGEMSLGDDIIGIANVSSNSEKEFDGVKYFQRVVVDCYYLDYQTLKTIMIYWNPNSLSAFKTETEKRESTITSRDINRDGVIEIPALREFANDTDERIVEWQYYNNSVWRRVEYTFSNQDLNYMVKIPSEWVTDIAIEKSSNNEYVFYKWDTEENISVGKYMTVKVFKLSRWEEIKNMYEHVVVRTNEAGTLAYVLSVGDFGAPEGLDLLISK